MVGCSCFLPYCMIQHCTLHTICCHTIVGSRDTEIVGALNYLYWYCENTVSISIVTELQYANCIRHLSSNAVVLNKSYSTWYRLANKVPVMYTVHCIIPPYYRSCVNRAVKVPGTWYCTGTNTQHSTQGQRATDKHERRHNPDNDPNPSW